MTNSQRLASVRQRLIRWLAQQDRSPNDHPPTARGEKSTENSNPILSESILIRDGFYCGRRFDLGSHRAVWFLEEDELKIFTADGRLCVVMRGDEVSGTTADAGDPILPLSPPDSVSPAEPPRSNDPGPSEDQDENPIRRAA